MENRKPRAMSSEKARQVRAKGHADAREFAYSIGLDKDYQNDPKAKKDVIDKNGDAHSVKSGKAFWQIFLYSLSRFEKDNAFKAMNGIGQIMIDCIKSIPENKEHYQAKKEHYKNLIAEQMIKLKNKLLEHYRLQAFLEKSIFNGAEVNYLTIKHLEKFHVFHREEVIKIFSDNFEVTNSIGNQKVLFKLKTNCGEIEMRNGEQSHHREMKFRLHKIKIINLLIEKIMEKKIYNEKVILYGKAIKTFR